MRIKINYYIGRLLIPIFLSILTGCGGISGDLKTKAQNIPEAFKQTEALIKKLGTAHERFKKTTPYQSGLIRYGGPERENWDLNFKKASEALSEAKEIYENTVKGILDRNQREEQPALEAQLKQISEKMAFSRQSAQIPGRRIARLKAVKKDMNALLRDGEEKASRMDEIFKKLSLFIQDHQKKYPHKKEDLEKRFAWFENARQENITALDVIQNEQAADIPDLAIFSDNYDKIIRHFESFSKKAPELRKKVSELDRSYSKILRDMKMEAKPWIEEVRYEWDNWSDFDTTREVFRRKKYIPMNDYTAITGRIGESGGIIAKGSDYEVWIENFDVDESYFHKYLFVEDDQQRTGNWEKVTEAFYDANENNLNMSILTKPVGVYEDEIIRVAIPPGFDKVGDPRYGKWEENKSTGERHWSFFEKYLFWNMILNGTGFGRNYYSYDRYNDWNTHYRGRKPYYGRNGKDFGSSGRSTMTHPGMKGSTYVRSGGSKTAFPGIRGAGAANRSRGPGAGK